MFSFSETRKPDAQAGLRERKRARTQRAILDAARELMESRGYEEATMEQVADKADVSVGSLYNYFSTKQALLIGVVSREGASLQVAGQSVVTAPGDDPCAAAQQLLSAYLEALSGLHRPLLRRVLGVSFSEPPEMSEGLMRLDRMLIEQLGAMLRTFQDRGSIASDVVVEDAAITLYGAFCLTVMFWLSLPETTLSAVRTLLDRQLTVVFRGLEPRSAMAAAT